MRGQRPFKVVRPKMCGDSSEVLREGADDLTLRAEEFDTLKARINVDHIDIFFGWTALRGCMLARFLLGNFVKELKDVSGKSCIIIAET